MINGVAVRPFTLGPEAAFPDGVALIVEQGCVQCDVPPRGYVRMYRGQNGQVRTDPLPKEWRGHAITRYITGRDGGLMASSVCTRGDCGGLSAASPDARSTIIWSRDAGVTWQQVGEFDGTYIALAVTAEGVVVGRLAQGTVEELWVLPSGRTLQRPPGAGGSWPYILALRSGELVWRSADGRSLLRSNGDRLADLGRSGDVRPDGLIEERSGGRFAVEWSEYPYVYLGIWSQPGMPERVFSQRFWGVAQLSGWLTPTTLIGTPHSDLIQTAAAIYDIERGIASPLQIGGSRVLAVMPGPFARVMGTGSCLNVRAEPAADARVLDCAADTVLLRDLGTVHETGDVTWLRVATPAGVEGWVSSHFVER
jgi:hypothetical protein